MRTWIRALATTPTALDDVRTHLAKMIASEDSLSKVKSADELHFQRGKVEGIRAVLSQINLAAEEKR